MHYPICVSYNMYPCDFIIRDSLDLFIIKRISRYFVQKLQLSTLISSEPKMIRTCGFHQMKVRCILYIKVFAFIFAFRVHLHAKNSA